MYSILPDATLTRALCCDCGQVRTVKRSYRPRRFTADLGSGYLASPRGRETYPFAQECERMVGDLKCVACETTTRHAILRDGDGAAADYAEQKDYGTAPTY